MGKLYNLCKRLDRYATKGRYFIYNEEELNKTFKEQEYYTYSDLFELITEGIYYKTNRFLDWLLEHKIATKNGGK